MFVVVDAQIGRAKTKILFKLNGISIEYPIHLLLKRVYCGRIHLKMIIYAKAHWPRPEIAKTRFSNEKRNKQCQWKIPKRLFKKNGISCKSIKTCSYKPFRPASHFQQQTHWHFILMTTAIRKSFIQIIYILLKEQKPIKAYLALLKKTGFHLTKYQEYANSATNDLET